MNFAMMLTLAATVSAAPAPKAVPGKETFAAKCATCHGQDAKGKAVMAQAFGVDKKLMDLTTALEKKTDADVVMIVTKGLNGKMPPFEGKLDKSQIDAVVSYVRSLALRPEKKMDEKKPAGKN